MFLKFCTLSPTLEHEGADVAPEVATGFENVAVLKKLLPLHDIHICACRPFRQR